MIGASFDALFLPLVTKSVSLISEAAPTKLQQSYQQAALKESLDKDADEIALKLGIPAKQVKSAIRLNVKDISAGQTSVTANALAKALNKPESVRIQTVTLTRSKSWRSFAFW